VIDNRARYLVPGTLSLGSFFAFLCYDSSAVVRTILVVSIVPLVLKLFASACVASRTHSMGLWDTGSTLGGKNARSSIFAANTTT